MRKTIYTTLLILLGLKLFSQINRTVTTDSLQSNKKYFIWASPSQATHVYGLMFNFWPRDDFYSFGGYPKIYGIEINIMPVAIFFPIVMAFSSLSPEVHKPPADNINSIDFDSFKKIYGLQIGLCNMEPSVIYGLDLSATGSVDSKTNGVTISAVLNKHYFVNGLTIGIMGNHDTKCNGVQIGLINTCKDLKGVQFGLWNVSQRHSWPIINICYRR